MIFFNLRALRRVLKVIWGLRAESPKRVFRAVQSLFRTGWKQPKRVFRTVQQTVFGLLSQRPENTFRTLLKHFLDILPVLTLVPGLRGRKARSSVIAVSDH